MSTALALPYPGLRPFEAEDQPLFFGREAQVSGMLRQLEDHRFVAVVGSSGSGKSSLVRAGLLPAVQDGFLLGTTDWLTIVIKPGHQPYQRLVRALGRATCRTDIPQGVSAVDAPLTPDETASLATLRRTDRGFLTLLGQMPISPESRVIVVVDQFEELFAFRRAGVNRDTVTSRDEAAAFVGMLLRSTSEPEGRVWVILTMRSDFIGDCEAFLGLPEQISHSQFLVPRLDRGQMEEAIRGPAAVQGGAFQNFTFEDGLVNRIINDAGDRPDQLPLMQHALMRTWKRAVARAGTDGPVKVTPQDYEAAGGIDMALSLHADAAWDEIKDDPRKADLARRLFLLLCDVSPDGQITRRRPQVAEIQAVTGASVADIEPIVRLFQQDDRNFLLPPPPQPLGAETFLDISHEALLRQWRRFAGEWQERERRDASELRRLAELASLRKQGQGVGLLPAQDLERIARWKQRVTAEWARRYVAREDWDEALRFVVESQAAAERERAEEREEAERRRQEEARQKQAEQKKKFLYAVAGILLVAMVFSVWQMIAAKKARIHAEQANETASNALTKPLLRTIGSSNGPLATLEERESLWDLAGLAPANVKVREIVIDQWFKKGGETGNVELAEKALNRQAQGLHAAVGLDRAMRDRSVTNATSLGRALAEQLKGATDIDRLSNLGSALAGLATQMNPQDAADFATPAASVLAKALVETKETSPEPVAKLATALAGLALWVRPDAIAENANRLKTGFNSQPETSAARLAGLATALEAFLARMKPADAAGLATEAVRALTSRLVDSQADGARRPSSVGQALGHLAARMEQKDLESIGIELAKALKKPEKAAQDELWGLGPALAGVAARLDSKTAPTVAGYLVGALVDSTVTERSHVWSLRDALVPVADQLPASDAGTFGKRLATALKNEPEASYDRLLCLGTALEALLEKMSAHDAAAVFPLLTDALEKPNDSPVLRLATLSRAFGAAVAKADPVSATSGVSTLAKALEAVLKPEGEKPPDPERLLALSNAVEALAVRLDAGIAQRTADAIIDALEKTQASGAEQTCNLTGALAALMEQKKVRDVAVRGSQAVAKALDDPKVADSKSLSRLGSALGRLSPLIASGTQTRLLALSNMLLNPVPDSPKKGESEPKEREQLAKSYALLTAADLVEVLKWPFCVGEAQTMALEALERKTTARFNASLWEFVNEVESGKIKGSDGVVLERSLLSEPAKRPKIEAAIEELNRLQPRTQ